MFYDSCCYIDSKGLQQYSLSPSESACTLYIFFLNILLNQSSQDRLGITGILSQVQYLLLGTSQICPLQDMQMDGYEFMMLIINI